MGPVSSGLCCGYGDVLKTPAGATIASIAYGYDANGNETSKTTTGVTSASANTYTYDARDPGETVPRGYHGDHMQDLQLGGSDTLDNLGALDGSVNTSLGPQIDAQIRGLPDGTKICGVSICKRP